MSIQNDYIRNKIIELEQYVRLKNSQIEILYEILDKEWFKMILTENEHKLVETIFEQIIEKNLYLGEVYDYWNTYNR